MNTGNKRPSGKGRPAGGKGKANSGFGDKKKSYGGSSRSSGSYGSSGTRSRSGSGSSSGGYGDKKRSYGEGGSSSGGYGEKRRSYGEGGSSSGGYGEKRRSYGEGGASSGGYGDKKRSYGEGGEGSSRSYGSSGTRSRSGSGSASGGYGDKKRSYGEGGEGSSRSYGSSGSSGTRSRSGSGSASGGYGDKKRSYGEGGASGGYGDKKRSYGEGGEGSSRSYGSSGTRSRSGSGSASGGYGDRKTYGDRQRSYGEGGSSGGGYGDKRRSYGSRDNDDSRADFNEYKEPQQFEGERVVRKRTAASEDRQGRVSSTPRADLPRGGRGKFGEDRGKFGDRDRAPRDMRDEEFEEEAPPERTRVGRYGTHSVTELPVLDQKDVDDEFVYGRNAVVAFLEGEEAQVNKIYIAKDTDPDRRLDKIVQLAKDLSIPTVVCDKVKLSTLIGDRDKHQGVVAQLAAGTFLEISEFLDWLDAQKAEYEAENKSMDGFSLAILDGIEDPHNIGAIIRSADASGVKAVLLPQRRSAGLTATVAKVSAGALASMKVVRITNIVSTLEKLKDRGFWVVGMSLEGATDLFKSDLKRPLALVIGSEGDGISRLVSEHCDMLVKIPMAGTVQSLNASVASGVVFYEVVRQNRQ